MPSSRLSASAQWSRRQRPLPRNRHPQRQPRRRRSHSNRPPRSPFRTHPQIAAARDIAAKPASTIIESRGLTIPLSMAKSPLPRRTASPVLARAHCPASAALQPFRARASGHPAPRRLRPNARTSSRPRNSRHRPPIKTRRPPSMTLCSESTAATSASCRRRPISM